MDKIAKWKSNLRANKTTHQMSLKSVRNTVHLYENTHSAVSHPIESNNLMKVQPSKINITEQYMILREMSINHCWENISSSTVCKQENFGSSNLWVQRFRRNFYTSTTTTKKPLHTQQKHHIEGFKVNSQEETKSKEGSPML